MKDKKLNYRMPQCRHFVIFAGLLGQTLIFARGRRKLVGYGLVEKVDDFFCFYLSIYFSWEESRELRKVAWVS